MQSYRSGNPAASCEEGERSTQPAQPGDSSPRDCLFCAIANGDTTAHVVLHDESTLAFLDHRPVFHGHVLLVPRQHIETLADLPIALVEPLFRAARLLARAVEDAMGADGTFVAINNRVSQSVPHLHVHVVPRKRRDGLRGFMWPRTRYRNEAHAEEVRSAIADAVASVRKSPDRN